MRTGHIGAAPEFVAAGVLGASADDINSRVGDINLNISCGQPGNIIAGTNCDDGPGRSAGQMCVDQLIVQVWLTVLMLMILAPALAQKLAAASIRDEASLVIIFNTLPG